LVYDEHDELDGRRDRAHLSALASTPLSHSRLAGQEVSIFGFMNEKSRRRIADLTKERDLLVEQVKSLTLCGVPSELDRTQYSLPPPSRINLWDWTARIANNTESSVLEIGAREVAGKSQCKQRLPLARYTGFDFHPGENVDVVGDAHRLSDYFAANSFDVVYSAAVYEHLAMPWVVAEEIAKVLRPGGVACILTHFSYSEHEMPWHFFQFNSTGLEALFNEHLGFKTVESGKELPMVGRFAYDCPEDHAGKPIPNLYCSSYLVTRKTKDVFNGDKSVEFRWRDALAAIYGATRYPAPAP
jgi:SAM-dependent methyltransferase